MQDTILTWVGKDKNLGIKLRGIKAVAPNGKVVAKIPQLDITLSGLALLKGQLAPRSITIFGPSLNIVRNEFGRMELGLVQYIDSNPSQESENGDLVASIIGELFSPIDVRRPFGYLQRIDIINANVSIDDRELEVKWLAPDTFMTLIRRKNNVYASAELVLKSTNKLVDKTANVNLSGDYNLEKQEQLKKRKLEEREGICTKCNKRFKSKKGLSNHIYICEGLSKLQCNICLKFFSSTSSKSHHKRNVLCFPPPSPPPPPPEDPKSENLLTVKEPTSLTTISNIQNNNQMTNSNNNNTINNIIQYNAFGDEGIEQLEKFLGDDSRILERFKQASKKRLYGVRDIQNDIFFNPENPQGFSIIKPDKYGSSVRVRNSEGEFEYMEFDDVRDPMLNYIEKFIYIYNKTRNKYNVKFKDPKERRILQAFFKIMNDDLDIYLNEDLKEDLDIQDESNESEDEDENNKYKQFDKLSLDNIHIQTKKYFKCKKGEFVLKEKT